MKEYQNMRFREYINVLILILCFFSTAQSQTIKGRIYLSNDKEPVGYTEVKAIRDHEDLLKTHSDSLGFYELNLAKEGSYIIHVTHEQFQKSIDIEVRAETVLYVDIYLETQSVLLENVTIHERAYQFGDLTMTQSQYKVMPASFQDPSRILIRYPGFSTSNDGANGIIFRGMPPESARWQLFGADIVNPNHLANAGTTNDLATGNAGGVNAINGTVLDIYHFEANPSSAAYSNVMSGVSNLKMAPAIKSYIDLNLIGLEAGLGTNVKGKNYYFSYRYSFTGLLNQFGIDFGNEKIGYQDLSAYADLIKNKSNHLKIFATLGRSHNYYKAIDTLESPTRFKDVQDIDYTSELGVVGAQYTLQNENLVYQSTLTASSRKDIRKENTSSFFKIHKGIDHHDNQNLENSLLSLHNQLRQVTSKREYMFGLRTNYQLNTSFTNDISVQNQFLSIYPYVQIQNFSYNKFHYNAGLGAMYDDLTDEITIEPALAMDYKIGNRFMIKLDYRLSSFQDYTGLRYIVDSYIPERIKLNNIQLSGQYDFNNLKLNLSGFYHLLHDVAKFTNDGFENVHATIFNGSNLGYDQLLEPFWRYNGTDKARIYGVEAYFQKMIQRSNHTWIIESNLTIFDSKYRVSDRDSEYFNGRYNFNYITNLSISYEKNIVEDDKQNKWIISIANHNRGGQREPRLIINAPDRSSLYSYNTPFDFQEPGYGRIDLRVVYSKKKVSSTLRSTWSLDIQNMLDKKNFGFRYYDFLLNNVIYERQLGLIPVLSYRLMWE